MEITTQQITEKAIELIEDGYFMFNHYNEDLGYLIDIEYNHIKELIEEENA